MIKDAETHAEEDKKVKELVDAKNQAEAMINGSEKAIKDLGDKADKNEVEKVNAAISDLKDEIKNEDINKIKEKTTKLTEAAGKIAEQAYKEQAAAQQQKETVNEDKKNNEAVDADFKEVDDEPKEPKADKK